MAGLQVAPKQVHPVAHLWPGHVRCATGGLTQRQLDESARDVAGINRLDGEARWYWRHGKQAQLPGIGQAVVVELGSSQDRPGQAGLDHDVFGLELRLRVSPGSDVVDTDYRHIHQVGGTRPARGCDEVAGCIGVAPRAGRAVDDGRRSGRSRLDALACPEVCGEECDAPFARVAEVTLPALINGAAGIVTAADGRPITLIGFTIIGAKIVAIDLIDNPRRIAEADLAILGR